MQVFLQLCRLLDITTVETVNCNHIVEAVRCNEL
jgi:hypothetical protein